MKGTICRTCKYMAEAAVNDGSGKKEERGSPSGKKLKYCTLYRNWCKCVAWNCKFSPDRPGPRGKMRKHSGMKKAEKGE